MKGKAHGLDGSRCSAVQAECPDYTRTHPRRMPCAELNGAARIQERCFRTEFIREAASEERPSLLRASWRRF